MKSAIHSIAKAFIVSVLMVAQVHFAFSQTLTSSILPPAKTTFFDQNGKPLTSGTVDFYIPGSTVRKTTWQDNAQTVPNTNPVVLDNAGRALILGSGNYRQVVKDRSGNLVWDQVTSSTGSSSGGGSTATGDGDLVGTVKPWAGMIAPNQYMFTYGQEVSRTTYAALLTAITSLQPISCTSGSPTLTGLTDTTNFWIGMSVETSCLASGASTVVSKTSTSVTLAANANVTTGATATFYPWGRGNGSTTFNLPDYRGQVLAGNNNMGGTASANLTTAIFGSATPNATGAQGGSQTTSASTSFTILTTNLPPYTPAGGINNGVLSSGSTPTASATGGSLNAVVVGNLNNPAASPIIISQLSSTFVGSAQGGASTPISVTVTPSTVQPTKTTNYIIKVLPDANSATASGVTSLASMTGDVACGFGLLCTGNNISVNNLPAPTAILKGGVFSSTCSTNNWFNTLDTTGTFGCSQPSFTSLTGNATVAQGGTGITSGTSGGILCFTSTTTAASSVLETANAIMLGGGAGACPAPMASLGTTTTVLHGNAAGPPTFSAVVSADMNITASNCTNQFVSAISTGGIGTCSTITLASAAFANQGTTTTLLHGNAAGNPSFGSVVSADMNITATNCTNQFVSAISTGGIGTCSNVPISTGVTGLGTGVATALGTAIGSVGAPIVFNGAGGTPSSITLTNATGYPNATNAVKGVMSGDGSTISCTAGVCTATGSSATAITVGTTTIVGGTSGQILTGGAGGTLGGFSSAPITNSLGADVSLSNVSNYFDGPSIAQGTTGTWFASGTVVLFDSGAADVSCKLWDGTTVIASARINFIPTANSWPISLSGSISAPAANIRISCRDASAITGKIQFNASGNSKDSTLTAHRLQ